jgi:signal transduction histidine kinase
MKRLSLSLRLILVGGLSICAAIAATGVSIAYLFELYFEDRIIEELETQLVQLTGNLTINPDGTFEVAPMSDHRFDQPLSGLYWQIAREDGETILSRSLWDQQLDIANIEVLGQNVSDRIQAPFGKQLMVLTWRISTEEVDPPEKITLTVATDLSDLVSAAAKFRGNLASWLVLLAVTLIVAAWFQVRIGLRPLEDIRTEIERTKVLPKARLRGDFPKEVIPLVDEVNSLLERQEQSLDQARARAADLAHGLKTPLTVIAALNSDIRKTDGGESSQQIDQQISAMRIFIERELARSRIAGSRRHRCNLAKVADQVVNAIRRLPTDSEIDWQIDIADNIQAPFDEHDMSELLGNLLDNARKFAASSVVLKAIREEDRIIRLQVNDDGSGVPEEQLDSILERGERRDTVRQGQGLGLAIVRDLADSHGCDLVLRNLPEGGFQISISWETREPEGH